MPKTFFPQQNGIKRLHNKVSRALSKDFFQSRCIGDGGYDDHRDMSGVFLQCLKHRYAVERGHLQIQQYAVNLTSVRRLFLYESQPLMTTACRDHAEPQGIQPKAQYHPSIEIIVDDEDETAHGTGLSEATLRTSSSGTRAGMWLKIGKVVHALYWDIH